ncbi:MAG: gamma-glutamyltransferase family protein [Burkholderiales bacterium]|jgi:gamma-glutamyltranspeptidase/glutathione hydrolase|nr:gamma-glutamyltransferase family protein [Burkholderiales bacterium]
MSTARPFDLQRDFEQPRRSVALGREAMAATSHPDATRVALDVLARGGNAMDAAIAACAVQGVVEPGSTGIGGDCFALIAPRGSDAVTGFNGSGRTPAAIDAAAVARAHGRALPRTSPHTVTVPGAVDAWSQLLAAHGTWSLAQALAPAIAFARDGYAVTPRVAADWRRDRDLLRADEAAARHLLVDGEAPRAGAVHRQPALADTLERIARDGRDGFYTGPTARDLVSRLRALGGAHTEADFAEARGETVQPICADYRGWRVHECPPNGQGLAALLMLRLLEGFAPGDAPTHVDRLHVELECARLAYGVRDVFVADPAHVGVPVAHLLSDAFVTDLRARVRLDRAMGAVGSFAGPAHRDTVYLCVVDRDRNAVSLINSIFSPYGSGIVGPASGVLLHNRGQSFALDPAHPNALAPRKRPMHTIIPGMVTRDGRAVMPFGVMGGHYQAMGQAVFLGRVLDHGCNPQHAMDLPRAFVRPGTCTVEAEATWPAATLDTLRARGFEVVAPPWAIGGAQAIWIDADAGTLIGGSDPRKDGCALGR